MSAGMRSDRHKRVSRAEALLWRQASARRCVTWRERGAGAAARCGMPSGPLSSSAGLPDPTRTRQLKQLAGGDVDLEQEDGDSLSRRDKRGRHHIQRARLCRPRAGLQVQVGREMAVQDSWHGVCVWWQMVDPGQRQHSGSELVPGVLARQMRNLRRRATLHLIGDVCAFDGANQPLRLVRAEQKTCVNLVG